MQSEGDAAGGRTADWREAMRERAQINIFQKERDDKKGPYGY